MPVNCVRHNTHAICIACSHFCHAPSSCSAAVSDVTWYLCLGRAVSGFILLSWWKFMTIFECSTVVMQNGGLAATRRVQWKRMLPCQAPYSTDGFRSFSSIDIEAVRIKWPFFFIFTEFCPIPTIRHFVPNLGNETMANKRKCIIQTLCIFHLLVAIHSVI